MERASERANLMNIIVQTFKILPTLLDFLPESDGVDCICQVVELFDPGLESVDRSPTATVQWYWQLDEFRGEKRIWRKVESMGPKPHPKEGLSSTSLLV